jgi:hypothetical protein
MLGGTKGPGPLFSVPTSNEPRQHHWHLPCPETKSPWPKNRSFVFLGVSRSDRNINQFHPQVFLESVAVSPTKGKARAIFWERWSDMEARQCRAALSPRQAQTLARETELRLHVCAVCGREKLYPIKLSKALREIGHLNPILCCCRNSTGMRLPDRRKLTPIEVLDRLLTRVAKRMEALQSLRA